MSDNTLEKSNFFLKNQVKQAERKLRKRKRKITSGKVIAEQSLGFWTALFESHHYKLLDGSIIACFPNKPTSINRSAIQLRLQKIRDFRNRVYHNEPICFDNNSISFNQAENVKEDIIDLLSWINPISKEYVEGYDNINEKIDIGRKI